VSIRRHEVSRLEGFSDAVFGFALTLLVVSLDTPRDFNALVNQMRGFVPFVLMFAMVCWIWYEHNVFFRRYGLQDPYTVFLNSVLLFTVLFYVYPLRYLTTALVGPMSMAPGTYPDIRHSDSALLMTLYSAGVLLIFGVFVLLHWHAWRQRHAMQLTALEELQLKFSARGHALSAGVAILSLIPRQARAGAIRHRWNGVRPDGAPARLEWVSGREGHEPVEAGSGRWRGYLQRNSLSPATNATPSHAARMPISSQTSANPAPRN
jgi:uncharacterized membrane protein